MIKSHSKWYFAVALCMLGLPAIAQPPAVTCSPGNDDNHPSDHYQPVNQCVGVVSDVPAATLLVPYFAVDLNSLNGETTLFTITESSATAVLAHVTIWSDLSVPVFNFNVYLTGYDTQTINMRDVLNGILPQTASAGQDPSDTISPKGPYSQDINFASCGAPPKYVNNFSSPYLPPPAKLTASQIANMVNALTGKASAAMGGMCAGVAHKDNIARGYITIDTVNNCTANFPSDPAYIGPSQYYGDITYQNNLAGEVYYEALVQGPSGQKAGTTPVISSSPLVHIVANATDPATSTSGRYTFYGRYDGWTAADFRQPLATDFAAHFGAVGTSGANGAAGGPQLLVWRDSKVAQSAFACPAKANVQPAWYPLGQEDIIAFDEQEHPQFVVGNPFPAETQMVAIGGSALPVTYSSGWLFLDLNTTVAAAGANPPVDPTAAQAWVMVVEGGSSATLHTAQRLDSATQPWHPTSDF